MTLDEALQLALAQHHAGRLAEAQSIYEQILSIAPEHAEACHLLGAVLHQRGDSQRAVEYFERSIALQPGDPRYLTNLALVLSSIGRWPEAMARYQEALAYDLNYVEARFGLGNVHNHFDQFAEAEACYREVIRHQPTHLPALNNLGAVQSTLKEYAAAEASFRAVLTTDPQSVEALFNLGNVLSLQKRFAEAEEQLRTSLAISPGYLKSIRRLAELLAATERKLEARELIETAIRERPQDAGLYSILSELLLSMDDLPGAEQAALTALRLDARLAAGHANLGGVYYFQKRLTEAAGSFQRALELDPKLLTAINHLALVCIDQEKYDEAIQLANRALKSFPGDALANCTLGNVHARRGDLPNTLHYYERAVELDAESAPAHFGRGLLRLMHGDFEGGWPDYEWRLKFPRRRRSELTSPLWHGEDLKNKTILLYSEQGFGDTFQFLRFAPLIKARYSGTILVETFEALLPILQSAAGIDLLIGEDEAIPQHDFRCPLMSLPYALRLQPSEFTVPVPYLTAAPKLFEAWRSYIGKIPGFKVGIAWQGDSKHHADRQRSIPLAKFRPLADVPGVTLISLQRGPGEEQIPTAGVKLVDLSPLLDRQFGAFMDSAAVMQHLDLFITADSAIAHLAGALGIPTWLALHHPPDWRWQLDRDDSPWYPTMRLFRQPQAGDWEAVFDEMTEELRKRLEA